MAASFSLLQLQHLQLAKGLKLCLPLCRPAICRRRLIPWPSPVWLPWWPACASCSEPPEQPRQYGFWQPQQSRCGPGTNICLHLFLDPCEFCQEVWLACSCSGWSTSWARHLVQSHLQVIWGSAWQAAFGANVTVTLHPSPVIPFCCARCSYRAQQTADATQSLPV